MSIAEMRKPDPAKAEAFEERMLDVLNAGALAIMISVGHRTGLFDALARLPASTSGEIAARAGLHERYVREWLAAMVTGRIVDYSPENGRYVLPPEHAAVLTRDAAPDNMAAFAQYIPLMGTVEDAVVRCFEKGGGVPYASYTRFQDVMAEDSGHTVVAALEEHILPLVPGLTESLRQGIEVLDVGCGSGHALLLLAERFPRSRFAGYDLLEEGLLATLREADRRGLTNLRLETRDAARLGDRGRYHLITAFDAVHDQASPDEVLAGIAAALRPDGTFLMQDIDASTLLERNLEHPIGTFLYTISCMHCMTVSLAQGGMGLGTMWGVEKAQEMLRDAGFSRVEVKRLPHDFQNAYFVCRRQSP